MGYWVSYWVCTACGSSRIRIGSGSGSVSREKINYPEPILTDFCKSNRNTTKVNFEIMFKLKGVAPHRALINAGILEIQPAPSFMRCLFLMKSLFILATIRYINPFARLHHLKKAIIIRPSHRLRWLWCAAIMCPSRSWYLKLCVPSPPSDNLG